jgi:hypothetical protein
VGCNFFAGTNVVGGIAIFSGPANIGENAPWYVINAGQMRFLCPAILAPKPITLAPNEKTNLDYRIAIQPEVWTTTKLESAYAGWIKEVTSAH